MGAFVGIALAGISCTWVHGRANNAKALSRRLEELNRLLMGSAGMALCNVCGETFGARIGDSMMCKQVRCEVCDEQTLIPRAMVGDKLPNCGVCGGQTVVGLLPRCPKCHSREVRMDPRLSHAKYD